MTNAIGNPPVPNPTEHNQWYPFANSGSVTAVETTQGSIAYEQVVVGAGAWTPTHWEWLGGPSRLDYCATLGMLFKRLEDLRPYFKERRNGGIGAFTPDNVPVFDYVADNAWVIADSNHGFKMIGVGPTSSSRSRWTATAPAARSATATPTAPGCNPPRLLAVYYPASWA